MVHCNIRFIHNLTYDDGVLTPQYFSKKIGKLMNSAAVYIFQIELSLITYPHAASSTRRVLYI